MLVADDYFLEESGPNHRGALIRLFLLCATCGGPLENAVSWVGFELWHRSRQLGIPLCQRLSTWPTSKNGWAALYALQGACEFERSFLGPLYKCLTLHPRAPVRRVLTSPVRLKLVAITPAPRACSTLGPHSVDAQCMVLSCLFRRSSRRVGISMVLTEKSGRVGRGVSSTASTARC